MPDRGRASAQAHPACLLALAVGVGVLLLVAGLLLRAHPVDLPAVVALNALHTGAWAVVADTVYRVFSPLTAVGITAVACLAIWAATRRFTAAAAFGATVALIWLPTAVAKLVVDRPRPVEALLAHPHSPWPTDSSFPSGHTAFVAALVLATWFLVRERRAARTAVEAVGVVLTAVVACSVVSDGLHYPTDVLASVAWACAMAPFAHWLAADVVFRPRAMASRDRLARHAGVPTR